MTEQLYPKPSRPVHPHVHRRWRVTYLDMIYEGGGHGSWVSYYRTRFGARFSAWLHQNVRSYGGTVVLRDMYANHEHKMPEPIDPYDHALWSNEIAAIVIEQGNHYMPDVFMHLGFRYAVADAILAAGFHKPDHEIRSTDA